MTVSFLEEVQEQKKIVSRSIYFPAQFLSYIFHPIFIPIYVVAFFVYVHPSYFSGFSEKAKFQTIIITAINVVIFPLLTILLLKALGFINSIFLHTRKDRIIPYMASGIFFFWAYTVFQKQEIYPPIMSSFILGIFLSASAALIANIYFKISMHAIGVAGWLGVFLVIAKENSMLMTWPIAIVLLIAGMVCTARLLISNHTEKDIYLGLVVGFAAQIIASMV